MATRTNAPPKPHLGFGTRIRKSPFFESTLAWGCKEYTTYNHMYFPVYYNTPEEDFWSLVNDVTLWDVSVERQVEIKGPDASKFTQLLTPRNLSTCEVNQCKYVLNTNYQGGILSDPILLRLAEDHWWYSISDSDLLLWAMGVAGKDKYDIELREPDVSPLQIQGPKSLALMKDLVGGQVNLEKLPFYGLAEAKIRGRDCIISRTGFSGESGFEIYLRNATLHAEDLWYAVLEAGKKHQLMVTAPPHCRRIQAGILSWGQDMDNQHNPFQCNLGYQVSHSGKGKWDKQGDYIGKKVLEQIRSDLKAGKKPYKLQLVGLKMGGKPIEDFAHDFWPISSNGVADPCGFVTSPWYHPDKKTNIAMGYVPFDGTLNKHGLPIGNYGKKFMVHLPDKYAETVGEPVDAEIVKMPFTPSVNKNIREIFNK